MSAGRVLWGSVHMRNPPVAFLINHLINCYHLEKPTGGSYRQCQESHFVVSDYNSQLMDKAGFPCGLLLGGM